MGDFWLFYDDRRHRCLFPRFPTNVDVPLRLLTYNYYDSDRISFFPSFFSLFFFWDEVRRRTGVRNYLSNFFLLSLSLPSPGLSHSLLRFALPSDDLLKKFIGEAGGRKERG